MLLLPNKEHEPKRPLLRCPPEFGGHSAILHMLNPVQSTWSGRPDPHSRSEDHALMEELIGAKPGEPEEQNLGLPLVGVVDPICLDGTLLLQPLHVAVDDLLLAACVERDRQPGTFDCRNGAVTELRVGYAISDSKGGEFNRRRLGHCFRDRLLALRPLTCRADLFAGLSGRHGS